MAKMITSVLCDCADALEVELSGKPDEHLDYTESTRYMA